ncbi:DUF7694 domain-containing protein [Xanthobacter versatilis]|uniref:DUF7694 domain-containing protein n=1 Tax=Xanthobacter autotrophicus (strain ATCC BAA-1158 / Py2) TaxID=78245 RepID=UPI003726C26D
MNALFEHLPRRERRATISDEARRRRSGDWGSWEKLHLPEGVPGGRGWTREVRAACRNGVFSVLVREVDNGDGNCVIHLAITSLSQTRPTWWEAQRIKNEICGPEATAIEVYPPQSEVVDGADMYHLWALPGRLPFGLWRAA